VDIFQTLEFSQSWIDLGIITPAKLQEMKERWQTGEDPHTEHYRWGAFDEFLKAHGELDADLIRALYQLGANDPDETMGGSIQAAIMRRKECPIDLLESAANSDLNFLRKIATQRLSSE